MLNECVMCLVVVVNGAAGVTPGLATVMVGLRTLVDLSS